MKLAEALRLGSVLPGYNWASPRHCAIGHSLRAAGVVDTHESVYTQMDNRWPWLRGKSFVYENMNRWTGSEIISRLACDMTMCEIADLVEPIEEMFLKEMEVCKGRNTWGQVNLDTPITAPSCAVVDSSSISK